MTNEELLKLYSNLIKIDYPGAKFSYGIARNVALLKPIAYSLTKASQSNTEAFKKFEKERLELCQEHAQKDERGKPKMVNNSFIFSDNEAFEKEFLALKKKHPQGVKDKEKQDKEFQELLEKEVKGVKLFKIKVADIPNEMRSSQMIRIFAIIDDDGVEGRVKKDKQ